jgi:hypothetical protein
MPSALAADLLVPPKSVSPLPGKFAFGRAAVLASPSAADLLPLGQLAGELRKLGVAARVVRNGFGPAAVRVHRNQSLPHEHYHLTIAAAGIEIFAGDDAGAYYAVQTLRELIRAQIARRPSLAAASGGGGQGWPPPIREGKAQGLSLRACRIEDGPDFARRGVYHDCSRGKVPTLQTLMELAERLAAWKINELQLYVENVFAFVRHPQIGRGFSPLTAAEMLALGDHCKLHHVRLVGSLASFGHLEKVLCLPAYRHLGEVPYSPGKPCMTLCPGDAGSFQLIRELYEEFVPLFEPRDFNICCDETWELGKGRSKARARKLGIGRVYLDFLLKLHRHCQGLGKRTNAWADIVLEHPDLLKDLPKDIVMLNWDYNANSDRMARSGEIARAGLPLVVCPGTSAWQTHGSRLANAIGNVRQAAEQGLRHGAEGLLNTDWGDGGHRNFLGVSLHGFAHGAACSWNSRGVNDKTFTRTFCRQVFAQRDDKLAGAVATLGASYKLVSDEYGNHCALYYTLVEPVQPGKKHPRGADSCKPQGLRQVVETLGNETAFDQAADNAFVGGGHPWPPPPDAAVRDARRATPDKGLEQFEALALREFAVAARMDVLSARRALAIQEIRAGKSPSLAALAADLRAMAADFAKLWMARNKPSRLKDNLRDLHRAAADLKR